MAHNDQWLAWLTKELTGLGLKVTPSVGNFILVHFPIDAAHGAAKADAFLTSRGIILSRKYSEMRLDNLRAAGRAIRETVKHA